MSLENQIAELTKAVNTLTETILKSDIGQLIKEQAEQIEKAVEEHAPEKVVEEKPQSKPKKSEKPTDDTPTVEEIKSLCMQLVRADKTKKQPILDALGEYGAKTVDKVPSDKLGELKAKLEAL